MRDIRTDYDAWKLIGGPIFVAGTLYGTGIFLLTVTILGTVLGECGAPDLTSTILIYVLAAICIVSGIGFLLHSLHNLRRAIKPQWEKYPRDS